MPDHSSLPKPNALPNGSEGAGEAAADWPDQPVLTIDLGALRHNCEVLRRAVAPATLSAVVKANAYGTGVERVAPVLAAAGVTTFFVAFLSEGLQVRRCLEAHGRGSSTIYVLGGLPAGCESLMDMHRLTPILNTLDEVNRWSAYARRHGAQPAALHVDTGMNRLGLSLGDVDRLGRDPAAFADLDITLILSHLACADEPTHPMNSRQLEAFRTALGLLPPAPASLIGSAGLWLGPEYRFDLVRAGIALYGGNPCPGRDSPLRPVVHLHAPVLQIREIAAGQSIGYGATYVANTSSRAAIVALGYGDGFLRALSNHVVIRHNGFALSLMGRVSMDSIALDVTAMSEDQIKVGDRIAILSQETTIDDLAEAAGTIPYEILTLLGQRYRRRYV